MDTEMEHNTEIEHRFLTVTPRMAREWLETQKRNRKLRRRKVERLVGLLKAGRWYPGVGSIVFDDDGVLIDGQHRLSAIESAETAALVLVVTGVHPDAKYWIDTGATRTGEDALVMAGTDTSPGPTATALSLLLRYRRAGHINTLWQPENEDLRDALREFPEIEDSVEATKSAGIRSIYGSHGTFAFLHFMFTRQDKVEAGLFFRAVLDGLGVEAETDVRHLLRQRLIQEASRENKISQDYVIKLALKAWALFREGEDRVFLGVKSSEGWPDIGPVPGVWEEAA